MSQVTPAPGTVAGQLFLTHDATALADLVRRGELSPRELTEHAIRRIELLDPRVNAVVHRMFERARGVADSVLSDGPFSGVPMLIKDLLAWYAGEPITSGSRLLRDFVPDHDSEIVRRYRGTGAVVVGKANTPEFGLTPFTEPELFGPTRNPWDLARTVGGSSGGSAAAVASCMVPLAAGGDGGGSIRIPASCCGVFGLKPTRGRVPTGPDQGELWQGAVVEGVITRSVRDSAAMLDAISGDDPGSPYSATPPARPFLQEVTAEPGRLRIAFTAEPFLGHEVHDDCRRALSDAVALLQGLGHTLIEATPPIDRDTFNPAFLTMICGELAADIADAERQTGRKAGRHDVEYATWALYLLGKTISAAEYSSANRVLARAARQTGTFFEPFDALLTPTLAAPPFVIGALQPPSHERVALKVLGALNAGSVLSRMGVLEQAAAKIFDWIPYTPLFNITGQPAMSVPLSWNAEGLPIGMQLVAKYGDEATLFRLAGQLERARPWFDRVPAIAKE